MRQNYVCKASDASELCIVCVRTIYVRRQMRQNCVLCASELCIQGVRCVRIVYCVRQNYVFKASDASDASDASEPCKASESCM